MEDVELFREVDLACRVGDIDEFGPVCAYVGKRPLPARAWQAVLREYLRNGGKMLTPGKLRWIKRRARRIR